MIIGKKMLFGICAFVMVMATIGGMLIKNVNANDKLRIVVDAGHGKPDGGAVGVSGVEEKDINLAIAKKLCEVLQNKGIEVIMTRDDDDGIWDNDDDSIRKKKVSDMHNRKKIMEDSKADLFISIHMNSFSDTTANGLHIFYDKAHPEAEELANLIQDGIADITGAKTHTVKTADTRLFLMKNPPMPAILVECGFISNKKEEEKLKNDEYQSKIAWSIAESVEKYYQILTNENN